MRYLALFALLCGLNTLPANAADPMHFNGFPPSLRTRAYCALELRPQFCLDDFHDDEYADDAAWYAASLGTLAEETAPWVTDVYFLSGGPYLSPLLRDPQSMAEYQRIKAEGNGCDSEEPI